MVTIKDVAQHAGVSLATASRALTGTGSASSSTRERVTNAAQELGYTVNRAARSLRTHRTDIIGLLISDVRNPFFAELAYWVEKEANASGFLIITANANETAEGQERALEVFKKTQVDGVLLVAQNGEIDLSELSVPTVFVDRAIEAPDICVVQSDNEGASESLVNHLFELGHRKIGVISGQVTSSAGRQRLDATLDALRRRQISPDPHWVQHGDFTLESGIHAAEAIFDLENWPTAIIACDNLMAVGVIRTARELDIRIGHDVGLVAFDDAPWFPVVDPPLTVASQNVPDISQRAVHALIQRINGDIPESSTIPTELIVRKSGEVRRGLLTESLKIGRRPR